MRVLEKLMALAERETGDPGRNRTDNIQLRRLALYPIELRGRFPPIITLESSVES